METFAPSPLSQLGIEGRMRVGLTDQDEGEPFLNQDLTDRLRRVEIIPKNSEVVSSIGGCLLVQPAFGGGVFTVLFGMPILWDNKLRRQRDDFMLMGRHDHRGQHPMGIGGSAVAVGLPRTLRAGDVL